MFERLLSAYPVSQPARSAEPGSWPFASDELGHVFSTLANLALDGGLYRVHSPESARRWAGLVGENFPSFAERAQPIGFDWLGRHFAADRDRRSAEGHLCLMLEPGTGQVLELPYTIVGLHQDGLIDQAEAALALAFYREWRLVTGDDRDLADRECVGYRIPLRLGGTDTVDNLERTDMEVYWSLIGQAAGEVGRLPLGTEVKSVRGRRRWRKR